MIINIHGGGYFYGTKETYQFYCLFVAQQGFAVINFNYRLAPDYEFPNNIEDVQRILNWVEINGSKFNLDLQHVFLVGDSAGGQMVVQTLIIDTNSKYRHLFGFVKPKLRILAGATNCGGFIIDNYRNLNKKSSDLDKIVTLYFMHHQKTAMCDLTKVQKYLTCNFPPIYIMTANLDFIKEQSILLDNFLKTKGVKHEFHLYGDEQHKLLHVFNIDQKNEIATQCNLDEIRFFKSFL